MIALSGCGGSSDHNSSSGTAALRAPLPTRESRGEALFSCIGAGQYRVKITAFALVANKTHELRLYSGSGCTTELEFYAAKDVTVNADDPAIKAGWRLTSPARVIATANDGSGELELTVESPPKESTLWGSTFVAVVGPIHPDPGYSGGTLKARSHSPAEVPPGRSRH